MSSYNVEEFRDITTIKYMAYLVLVHDHTKSQKKSYGESYEHNPRALQDGRHDDNPVQSFLESKYRAQNAVKMAGVRIRTKYGGVFDYHPYVNDTLEKCTVLLYA